MAIYFIEAPAHRLIKIGASISPKRRLANLQAWSPTPLELIAQAKGCRLGEAYLHHKLRDLRVRGEWFSDDPRLRLYVTQAAQSGVLAGVPLADEGGFNRGVAKNWCFREIAGRLGCSVSGLAEIVDMHPAAIFQISNYLGPRVVGRVIAVAEERGVHLEHRDFFRLAEKAAA